jgi:trk system potassium uptake protein TrkA
VRAVIVGAGRVGQELARNLCAVRNDVVVIDPNVAALKRVAKGLHLETIQGDGSKVPVLHRAGVNQADLLLALTSQSATNILACCVAKRCGVARTVARIRSEGHFSPDISGPSLGVDLAISTEEECAADIVAVLRSPQVKETARLTHPDAQLVNLHLPSGSPLLGKTLAELRDSVCELRICAFLRHGALQMPRGNSSFLPGDELYVAGAESAVTRFVNWAAPSQAPIRRVVIAGATHLAFILEERLRKLGMRVILLEEDAALAESAAERLGGLVVHGDPTQAGVLREARIDRADAFVSMQGRNEGTIISCMLAKQAGARKTIAVTNSLNHLRIITGVPSIDCGFSPRLAAINRVSQHIAADTGGIVTALKRAPVEVREFLMQGKATAAGRAIRDIAKPCEMIIASIVRDGHLLPAVGEERLLSGDRVCVVLRTEHMERAAGLFRKEAKA